MVWMDDLKAMWKTIPAAEFSLDDSCSKTSWQPVTSYGPLWSIMGQMLCNIFINDLSNGSEWTLAEFADDSKLWRALETLENKAVIQKDLDKLDEWSGRSFLEFRKSKCFILHLEHDSPIQQHRLRTDWFSGRVAEKRLVLMVSEDKSAKRGSEV